MKCNCRNCKHYDYVSGEFSNIDSKCSLNLDWTKCSLNNQLKETFEWEGMGQ